MMNNFPKAFILFIILISARTFLYGQQADDQQSAFYDAKFIYENCFDKDDSIFTEREALFDLLAKKYYPEGELTIPKLKENPFFAPYVPAAFSLSGGKRVFSQLTKSALSGLNVTKYADAVSEIMIERAKQELTIAFFNRFKKFSDENSEFQILFPKTTSNLNTLFSYTYPQMLPALRGSFLEDLKLITYNLDDVILLPKYRLLLNKFPEVRVAIRSVKLIHQLESGDSNVAEIIKAFGQFPEWQKNVDGSPNFKNIKSTVQFAAIFSESLRSSEPGEIWVKGKEVKSLVSNEIFTRIFMGLVYQQIKNNEIKFYLQPNPTAGLELTEILKKQVADIIIYQHKMLEFIGLTEKIVVSYNEIYNKQRNDEKLSDEDVFNYIDASLNIVDYSLNVIKVFDSKLISDSYLAVIKKSHSLYRNVSGSNYTQTINDAVDFLTSVHDLAKSNLVSVDPAQPLVNSLNQAQGFDSLINFVQKVKPYALFMANMAEAKDATEVKAALENVILPVGSSAIKKNTVWNISVQSYLGAFLSTRKTGTGLAGSWKDKFGASAPIGISWTPGFLSRQRKGSISLFTSLLDLGAIVDYKLQKEPNAASSDPNATVVKKDYEVQLGQIFSPGIYAVYGFFENLPLSLGFGAQYGPGLSKIDSNNNLVVNNPSWRSNFFFSVDLPFFTLKNKMKEK